MSKTEAKGIKLGRYDAKARPEGSRLAASYINFYQGEKFVVDASNDNRYIHIWDTYWEHVELYDIDEFARIKKAINLSNLNCATTTVYTIDEAGSNVDVHCKAVILFIPQIPEIENYLRGELNDFFRAHQFINGEMAKMKEQEESIKSNIPN